MKHEETTLQTAIIRFMEVALPRTYRAFHVPNNPRNKIHGGILKSMGMVAGFPDVGILGQGGSIALLEVKTDKGHLSKAQREFRDWCGLNGVPYAVVRSIRDVEETLDGWNVPLKARAA